MAIFPVFGPAPQAGEAIGSRIPYLMVGFFLLTTYSVAYDFAVVTLILGQSWHGKHFDDLSNNTVRLVMGIVLLAVTVVSKVFWVGAWAYGLYITHWSRRHVNPTTTLKRVMQSDPAERVAIEHGQPASNARFKRCRRPDCTDRKPYGDRVYHCTKLGRHYPLYDHYCHYLWVVVYLDTIKTYFCTIFWLGLDGILCMSASFAAVGMSRSGLGQLHSIIGVFSGILAVYITVQAGWSQFKWLAFRNVVGFEWSIPQWTMVRTIDTPGGKHVQFVTIARSEDDKRLGRNWNPWSLSLGENFRQALGERVWTWPLFWVQPRRVRQYGKSPTMESDLPLGPLWRRFEREPFESEATWTEFLPLPPIAAAVRRGIARSSGIELA
ncbi:hypothetical protein CONLIGDRAFT_693783 [Coniochaeta ligniaria NRRL 30616]|uniref:Palmitoyltransferase n=1 Tax=Coniochaeta ligniaria NRRL 30616 TaxID=1408157 RepID=A0A1J7J6V2_9PEZI|nr:hypothetical protein CONLIGDRAFT_693783 [Coniochaeta ligniaria NRRL 30616]